MARDWMPEDKQIEGSERASDRDEAANQLPWTGRSRDHAESRDDLQRQSSHSTDPRREVSLRGPRVLYDRDRGYRLTDAQIQLIVELGKFRILDENNATKQFSADRSVAQENLIEPLVKKGVVRRGVFEGPEGTPRGLITLTKRGRRLLHANRLVPNDQATYSGFVKPREANHDADLYPLYLKEVERIETSGGRVRRVLLDFELKQKVNQDLARVGAEARPEIAERHGLTVVRDKIPLPDVQIEYETRDGAVKRVNLELVSEHYRGRNIGEKAQAGFVMYALRGEGSKLRRILDQQELTAEILSL